MKEFRRCGRVDMACASQGVNRSVFYEWLKQDPDYKRDFEDARTEVAGLLEDEAVRRAYHGQMRPVSIAGKLYMVTEMSDQLLMFLLKGRNRAVFGDRQEITGKDGKPFLDLESVKSFVRNPSAAAE